MTEFLGTGGSQIAYEVTGLTAAAEEVVAARAAGQHERHPACDEGRRGILSRHIRLPRI